MVTLVSCYLPLLNPTAPLLCCFTKEGNGKQRKWDSNSSILVVHVQESEKSGQREPWNLFYFLSVFMTWSTLGCVCIKRIFSKNSCIYIYIYIYWVFIAIWCGNSKGYLKYIWQRTLRDSPCPLRTAARIAAGRSSYSSSLLWNVSGPESRFI